MTNRTAAARRWANFKPPGLPEAEKHADALRKLARMTPDQVFTKSVEAGIHNADGTLTDHYRASKPPQR